MWEGGVTVGIRDLFRRAKKDPPDKKLQDELEKTKEKLLDAQCEHELLHSKYGALEQECGRLRQAMGWKDYRIQELENRISVFEAAWKKLCPPLRTLDQLRCFYDCMAPYLDPDGFQVYFIAQSLTDFDLSGTFPYEDASGLFENADGHMLMKYLEADQFGSIDWEIVPGTTYERAVLRETDRSAPEYLAFQKQMYAETIRHLGFQSLLSQRNELTPSTIKQMELIKRERGDAR